MFGVFLVFWINFKQMRTSITQIFLSRSLGGGESPEQAMYTLSFQSKVYSYAIGNQIAPVFISALGF